MNYIHRLQANVAESDAKVKAYERTISELRAYLLSEKFHNDPTVQTRDVLHRIEQGLHYNLHELEAA